MPPHEKRGNIAIRYYLCFIDLLWEILAEDDFRRTCHEAIEEFIRCKKEEREARERRERQKRQEDQLKELQQDRLKELEERMKANKDIL